MSPMDPERRMQFVYALRSHGVTNPDVLRVMEQTPREEFLEAARLPDEAGLAAQIQQKIRDYYATHRGGSTP